MLPHLDEAGRAGGAAAGAEDTSGGVENLGGWLTTVVARVSLDMLRSRKSRREEPWSSDVPEPAASQPEALLADSIGPALLVVLETLAPADRVAFVLHDMFAVPFDEIAAIVDDNHTCRGGLCVHGGVRHLSQLPVTNAAGQLAGHIALFNEPLIAALHVVELIVSSTESLADLLEAAGSLWSGRGRFWTSDSRGE